ncbi:uncharacterized PKHD-type hydroxylase-like protein [Tanacetum coccineum]
MSEPSPGIYEFDMLQPRYCEMLISEVENFEKWVRETNFELLRPNSMNNYGAVLDDFGMEGTLDTLMKDFVRHISKVYFTDVGGFDLDSHHGFVVVYGVDRDLDLGFHTDDSEVTLNVCLGKQFTGGDLFFRGMRCEDHVNGQIYPEEVFDFSHNVGRAIVHRGRHRHGATATTTGHRINLILWCRSSVYREMKEHKNDFPEFCGECKKGNTKKKGLAYTFTINVGMWWRIFLELKLLNLFTAFLIVLVEAAATLEFALAAYGGRMVERENLSPQQPP